MNPTEFYSLAHSVGILIVALALSGWQWAEHTARPTGLSPEDALHFARLDRRRQLVAVILVVLAAGIFVGSRLDYRANDRPNPWFLATWLTVFWLLLILTVFAVADWLATRRYARRHRRAMAKEGLEILRDEMRYCLERAPAIKSSEVSDGPPPPLN